MKLTVFNGSPRGRKSNTRIVLEHFLKGFSETEGNKHEVYYLNRVKEEDQFTRAFSEAVHNRMVERYNEKLASRL